jgi:hypothetical protein
MPREMKWSEWIEQLVRDYGLTEDDAYVYAYLVEAQRIYFEELPEVPIRDDEFIASIEADLNILAYHVVRRDHPEGWLTDVEWEERQGRRED